MIKRIITGVIIAGIYVLTLYAGGYAPAVVFCVGAVIAVKEISGVLNAVGYRLFILPAYIFALLYAFVLSALNGIFVLLLMALCIMAVIVERVLNKNRKTEESLFSLVPIIYPLTFFCFLVALYYQLGNIRRVEALIAVAALPLFGDTFAYFIGCLFGKRKLCPHISPNKTVAGSIASFFGCLGAGGLMYGFQHMWAGELGIGTYLFMGFLCGAFGQAGDLFASVLKRWANVKDYGNLFPGHGGVMDRLDSMLFCAPVIFFVYYFTL